MLCKACSAWVDSFSGGSAKDGVRVETFGASVSDEGRRVHRVTLRKGLIEAQILTYGATLQGLSVPDRDGVPEDVVLGFDSLAEYEDKNPFFGSTVGRTAGRIDTASDLDVDGVRFTLEGSDGDVGGLRPTTNLHGGKRGFDKRVWTVDGTTNDAGTCSVTLRLRSEDGDQGFPGDVDCAITYRVTSTPRLALTIEYEASSTRATPLSLTNHSYFNLGGATALVPMDRGDAGDSRSAEAEGVRTHTLQFAPLKGWLKDNGSGDGLFTGDIGAPSGIHEWSTEPVLLSDRLKALQEQQPSFPHGDAYVLASASREGYNPDAMAEKAMKNGNPSLLPFAAVLSHGASGRVMRVYTSEPVVQTYFSTLLDCTGKGGIQYCKYGGVCLETQRFANATNISSFPSNVCHPHDPYRQVTTFEFSTDSDDAAAAEADEPERALLSDD